MKPSQVEINNGIVRRHPWLTSLCDPDDVDTRIRVSRVDTEFLQWQPCDTIGTCASGWSRTEAISLHDDIGRRHVDTRAGTHYHNDRDGSSHDGEVVADAVSRYKREQGEWPAYIVAIHNEDSDSMGSSGFTEVVLRRPPKQGWDAVMEERQAAVEREVSAMMEVNNE